MELIQSLLESTEPRAMPGTDCSQETLTGFYSTTGPIRLGYNQTLTGNVSFLLTDVAHSRPWDRDPWWKVLSPLSGKVWQL